MSDGDLRPSICLLLGGTLMTILCIKNMLESRLGWALADSITGLLVLWLGWINLPGRDFVSDDE